MSLILLKKNFGQVFTPKCISNLLVNEINELQSTFNATLDMGAGIGELTKSVCSKNMSKQYDLVEIDPDLVKILEGDNELSKANIYNIDILDFNFKKYDLIISNPPFIQFEYNKKREFGDIIFLELMWNNLEENSVFSFIVTNNFISNSKYKKLRKKILSNISYLSIVELDSFVYLKTEVQSFIITAKKSKPISDNVILKKSNIYGDIDDYLVISKDKAMERMDFSYYFSLDKILNNINKDFPLLGDIAKNISRGSKSNNYFKSKNIRAFHTTDFNKNSNLIYMEDEFLKPNYKTLNKGDIVIPRVGSRCLNYNALIEEGSIYYTDCIYRISVDEKFKDVLFNSISSKEGIIWRQISSTGSCAKHLTLQTLKNMPLFV